MAARVLCTNRVDISLRLLFYFLYTGNSYGKALPNTLLYGNCLYFSKGYNVAFEFV